MRKYINIFSEEELKKFAHSIAMSLNPERDLEEYEINAITYDLKNDIENIAETAINNYLEKKCGTNGES